MSTETASVAPAPGHCRRCGLIAPEAHCPGCDAPVESGVNEEVDAADLPPETRCAVVRVEMQCRVCGLQMPVNHLPTDGKIRCLHCDRAQAPDDDAFSELVDKAHGVVDMAGEEGPYERVGVHDASVIEDIGSGNVLVGPGLPRCFLCAGALKVSLGEEEGVVSTTCHGCNDHAEYTVQIEPDWQGVVGAIAPEHRTDRLPARRSVEGSVVALSCPKCGGPLDPEPQQQLVECSYCDTKSLIVEETWALIKGAPPKQAWYLLLRGPSHLRRELDSERQRRMRRAEAERNKQRKAENRAAQRSLPRTPAKKPSWYEKNRSLVAGYSTIVSAFACCGLIAGGTHLLGFEEETYPAGFVAYFVVAGIGIGLQGKGKIAAMPTKTATRVFHASAICFLISLGAFLVMLTMSGN